MRSAELGFFSIRFISIRQALDQTIHTTGIDFFGKLGAVVFNQPDAQDIQVKNFPTRTFTGRFFKAIVQLNRFTSASDLGLNDQIFVIFGARKGLTSMD